MLALGRYAFLIAFGIAAFGALIHWIAPWIGPDWYAFLGAPAAALESARQGGWLAPAGAALIGALMGGCGLLALSGAGIIGRLPLLRSGLVAAALVCSLRGALIFPLLAWRPERLMAFDIVASLVWLAAGLGLALGTLSHWPRLRPTRPFGRSNSLQGSASRP